MKAIKISVAASVTFCMFIIVVLVRSAQGSLEPVFGEWAAFVAYLTWSWAGIMMIIGNIGLWFLLTGFKGVR